jgi:predicted ABC-class ATPase
VPLRAPEALRTTIELPHAGAIGGLGVPRGITLVVGGGFHGKTTLLRAIEEGVYDHAPGDGRERCVTRSGAVKIRAGDGRRIAEVDVSPFVADAPGVGDTTRLSTEDASGSTSQAASIIEALELGADVLLFDEDTCAVNLMVRDRRMQELVADGDEPIRPLIDHVRGLRDAGVSVVLVAGSSGEWLDVADTVIQMRRFAAVDVTDRAHAVARERPTGRRPAQPRWTPRGERRPDPAAIDAVGPHGHARIAAPLARRLLLGPAEIDLGDVDQLLEATQTKAIGLALLRVRALLEAGHTLAQAAARVTEEVEAQGLDLLDASRTGDLAGFRRFELAATLNRLRPSKHTDAHV